MNPGPSAARLIQEARACAARYASFHKGVSGMGFSRQQIEDAAVDAALDTLAAWAGSEPVDDQYLPRRIEAALGGIRRARTRAQQHTTFREEDDEHSQTSTSSSRGVDEVAHNEGRTPESVVRSPRPRRRAVLRPAPDDARQIAKQLEAFENEIYQAIRSGALFRVSQFTLSGDYLLGVTKQFAWRVAPVPRRARREDVRAWRALTSVDRDRQIDATRSWYEGDDDARAQAQAVVHRDEFRLVRAVFWRD